MIVPRPFRRRGETARSKLFAIVSLPMIDVVMFVTWLKTYYCHEVHMHD